MNNTLLSYEDFVLAFKEALEAEGRLPELGRAVRQQITRNNGIVCDAIIYSCESSGCMPIFYCRDWYARYQTGKSPEALAEEAADLAAGCFRERDAEGLTDMILDYDRAKERLIFRAVNADRNRELLEHCPHVRQLDLALTFRLRIDEPGGRQGTVLVSREIAEAWQVDPDTLYAQTAENMKRLYPPRLDALTNVLERLAGEGRIMMENPLPMDAEDMPIYVLTNESGQEGASVLFYTDQVRRFAQRHGCDALIFPSSIHELLLIPETFARADIDYSDMVREINTQVVSDEEILSDHVYRYSLASDCLMIEQPRQ